MRNTASGTHAHTPESPRFTPGPWHEHSHRQIGPDAGIVCEVWAAIGWGESAIAEADANVLLLAAAPDLFAALEAVADEITEGVSTNPDSWLPAPIALQVFAALRLAQEGRQ